MRRLRIDTTIVTYNGMGGHRAISYAGALLLGSKPPPLGTAIDVIEVYCHIDDPEPPAPTLGPLLAQYLARVKTMPLGTFYRRAKRVELAFHSSLRPTKNLIGDDPRPASLSDVPLVRTVYREVVPAMELIRRKVKASDDFDAEMFLAHVQDQVAELDDLPAQAVLDLLNRLRATEQKHVAANRPVE